MIPTQWKYIILGSTLAAVFAAFATGLLTFDQLKEIAPWIVSTLNTFTQ